MVNISSEIYYMSNESKPEKSDSVAGKSGTALAIKITLNLREI
jgi:hypothetical protein